MRLRLLTATLLMVGSVGATPKLPVPTKHVKDSSRVAHADRAVMDAMTVEREASARVRHYAAVTMMAEHDLQIARERRTRLVGEWEVAADHDPAWSNRHAQAMLDERTALSRVLLYRAERDLARVEFTRAASELEIALARLERVVATLRATGNAREVA